MDLTATNFAWISETNRNGGYPAFFGQMALVVQLSLPLGSEHKLRPIQEGAESPGIRGIDLSLRWKSDQKLGQLPKTGGTGRLHFDEVLICLMPRIHHDSQSCRAEGALSQFARLVDCLVCFPKKRGFLEAGAFPKKPEFGSRPSRC